MKSKSYRKEGNYYNSTGTGECDEVVCGNVHCCRRDSLFRAVAVDIALDEIVVTAKSLEENLPQQLSQYGTAPRYDLGGANPKRGM